MDTQTPTIPPVLDLWTFQPIPLWHQLRETGRSWNPDPSIGCNDWGEHPDDPWPRAYEWMIQQMITRGVVNDTGLPFPFPLWAYWWWSGINQRKPDLRHAWAFRKKGGCVFMHLRVPRDRVLLSDFDSWHSVLNFTYCAENETEYDEFYRQLEQQGLRRLKTPSLMPKGELLDAMERSWHRIFDVFVSPNDEWNSPWESRQLQATMFSFHLEHVAEAWKLPAHGEGGKVRIWPAK